MHRVRNSSDPQRLAFTVLELLVAIAVIGLLLAILLPAVQQVRGAARQTECASQLRQLSTAATNYSAAYGMFPPGATNHATWLVAILPYVDQAPLFREVMDGAFVGSPAAPSLYHCPSDGEVGIDDTNYAGNFGALIQRDGANGMFRHGPVNFVWANRMAGDIKPRDVSDGLSNTAMMAEVLALGDRDPPLSERRDWRTPERLHAPDDAEAFVELCSQMPTGNAGFGITAGDGWHVNGMFATFYTHHLPPNSPRCSNGGDLAFGSYSPSSAHPGGANVAMGDGRLLFVSESTDRKVWQAAGSRDGGEATDAL